MALEKNELVGKTWDVISTKNWRCTLSLILIWYWGRNSAEAAPRPVKLDLDTILFIYFLYKKLLILLWYYVFILLP